MHAPSSAPLVAIACGGTGGHLFPGLAVAEVLESRGVDVLLLISRKEVDQQAVRGFPADRVACLDAVGLERGRLAAFARGFGRSFRQARRLFRSRPPTAFLSLGGFTSVPPALAARLGGAAIVLHEANSIPGRANRWLAHLAHEACVYFDTAAERLWTQRTRITGMPVRAQFQAADAASCRAALGLKPQDPLLLVTGGSQGARALNELAVRTLPALRLLEPRLQVLHLTGPADFESVRRDYAGQGASALVRPFLTEMDLALGAATVTLSRAGASSLAETAAMHVPALLVPYPAAADNHQFHNARAFVESGAARMLNQPEATPENALWEIRSLMQDGPIRARVQQSLARWHFPGAAEAVADSVLSAMDQARATSSHPANPAPQPGSGPVVLPLHKAKPHAGCT